MVAIIIACDSNGGQTSVDKTDMVRVFTELTAQCLKVHAQPRTTVDCDDTRLLLHWVHQMGRSGKGNVIQPLHFLHLNEHSKLFCPSSLPLTLPLNVLFLLPKK